MRCFFLYLPKLKSMKILSILLSSALMISCANPKTPLDLLVVNAKVYTVNSTFDMVNAIAVADGKIVEIGNSAALQQKYDAKETLNAEGKTIVPGLIDAHAHLYGLGLGLQDVDLVGTESKDEVLQKLSDFEKDRNSAFVYGRGWDQNDWPVKEFPTKEDLDLLFPNTPVALSRIDGHALWVNTKALELAGITSTTRMDGGEVILKDGEPSGILVDAPASLVYNVMPKTSRATSIAALLDAERICLDLGLTSVNDAGLDREIIELIDSLQQAGTMKLKVYAMVSDSPENLDYYLNKGIISTDRLTVRSVKVYGDGAMGSRGAALRAPYSDQAGHYGAMSTTSADLEALAQRIAQAGYQMNTHAIGDSANISVLRAYQKALVGKTDARWKIEHAQVISAEDFEKFSGNIIPSVQPTHATSDMYWVEDRLGAERIKGAYAYKTLLKNAGIIALGTDFPVEEVNPMHTFYAAVARKDLKQFPAGGYHKEEALSREETLKGMTIWAAYSNFEEKVKGSLEAGKAADFILLDKDIMQCPEDEIPTIRVVATYINGEKVK